MIRKEKDMKKKELTEELKKYKKSQDKNKAQSLDSS